MEDKVLLGHGSGGTMMKRIIDEIFFEAYASDELLTGDDAAVLYINGEILGNSNGKPQDMTGISFSTDSFVVDPCFFPGGNIGKLAICGTVNDIATSGAIPKYLSCGFILEEGFPIKDLRTICKTMAETAQEAEVRIVTGDTKVVNKGHGDGVFINTSGIGILPSHIRLSGANCKPGDKILLTGTLGDHGITIMSCRESLSFDTEIISDAAPLNHLIQNVINKVKENTDDPNNATFPVRCFRDPTRGGIASTLNELANQSNVDMVIDEESIPVLPAVQGACDMLGYDVLQVANEGKMICVVAPESAELALQAMKKSTYGENAAIIGEVQESNPERGTKVFVRNAFGGKRVLDMLVGEQLPRIC